MRSPRTTHLARAGLALLVALAPLIARAQEPTEAQRRATPRALFEEGVAFAHDERWAEAADRFQRTLTLQPTPVVAYNLATAQIRLGRIVEASENLRTSERLPGAEPQVRAAARALLAEIEPQIAHLRIIADPSGGAHVERDGHALTRAELAVWVPADPGTHLVALIRGGETVVRRRVELAPGARADIVLGDALAARTAARVAFDDEAGGDLATQGGGDVVDQWWFWTIIGVVIAGAVAGISAALVTSLGAQAPPVAGDLDPPIVGGMVIAP